MVLKKNEWEFYKIKEYTGNRNYALEKELLNIFSLIG